VLTTLSSVRFPRKKKINFYTELNNSYKALTAPTI